MGDTPYDPHSTNAMFSRILTRLDEQDRNALEHRREMKETVSSFQTNIRSTDDRVHRLENAQWRQRGFVAAIAFAVPLAWHWITGTKQ